MNGDEKAHRRMQSREAVAQNICFCTFDIDLQKVRDVAFTSVEKRLDRPYRYDVASTA